MIVESMQSRRRFLTVLAASPLLRFPLRVHRRGNDFPSGSGYRFLPGGPVFAAAAVATGIRCVHAVLARWLRWSRATPWWKPTSKSLGRPMHALWRHAITAAAPVERRGVSEFNAPYVARLKTWTCFTRARIHIAHHVFAGVESTAEPSPTLSPIPLPRTLAPPRSRCRA